MGFMRFPSASLASGLPVRPKSFGMEGPYTSASSTATFSPREWSPNARFIAVVDLPTPPLPEATATKCLTPGMPWRSCWAELTFGPTGRAGCCSAVSATNTLLTPGSSLTTFSTTPRRASMDFRCWGSVFRANITLPSKIAISDTSPADTIFPRPSGAAMRFREARTISLVISAINHLLRMAFA